MRKYIENMKRTDKLLAGGLAIFWIIFLVIGVIVSCFFERYLRIPTYICMLSLMFAGFCKFLWCKGQNMSYIDSIMPFSSPHYIEGRNDLNMKAFLFFEAMIFFASYMFIFLVLPILILMTRLSA